MYDLDAILNAYSAGCNYVTVEYPYEDNLFPFWFDNFESPTGMEAPTKEQVIAIGANLVDEGAFQTFDSAVDGFVALVDTRAMQKIMESAVRDSAPLLYGILAILTMGIYLYKPGVKTASIARSAWQRFVLLCRENRDVTLINDDEVVEFDELVSNLNLPTWLMTGDNTSDQ